MQIYVKFIVGCNRAMDISSKKKIFHSQPTIVDSFIKPNTEQLNKWRQFHAFLPKMICFLNFFSFLAFRCIHIVFEPKPTVENDISNELN